jgi:hypothetical protein
MKNPKEYLEDVLFKRIKQDSIVSLVCTYEEVDFAAKSIIEILETNSISVNLTCFWNELILPTDVKTAIITRKYQENTLSKVDYLILIDSTSLDEQITKTNLFNVLANLTAENILIIISINRYKNTIRDFITRQNKLMQFCPKNTEFLLFEKSNTKEINSSTPKLIKQRRKIAIADETNRSSYSYLKS